MPDYIIIGAGSAGCVLAARLSEDPDASVLLLEAGDADDAQEIHVPALFPALFKTRFDWDLGTDKEPALGDRKVYLPCGRMLGGSSSINAMIYIRGNRADWDSYAAAGATGWDYEDMLPYFKRSEDNVRGADRFHGTGGPLTVSDSRSKHELMQAWLEAALEAGLAPNPDFNGAVQDGAGFYQLTQRDGRRCSTAAAFLHPAMTRPNLEVLTGAVVHRVIVENGRAAGVELHHAGAVTTVRADREVIVAAGSYGSPKILLLSGIGPADELAPLGIECVADLPVGENLADHPMSAVVVASDTESLLAAGEVRHQERYAATGDGPLSSGLVEAGGFFRTRDDLDAPDIQFHALGAMVVDSALAPITEHGWISSACLLAPESRGKLSLRSAVPSAKPRIAHRYLSTDADRAAMIAGVRKALEIAEQAPLAKHTRAKHPTDYPASDGDADIWDHIQRTTQTLFHPTGTCSIGPVVDAELRVHGIDGLRVADASIFPTVPRGNTNAPSIAVGEKAADLVRGITSAVAADSEAAVAGRA